MNTVRVILAKWLLLVLHKTCCWRVDNEAVIARALQERKSVIIAVWHGRLLAPFFHFSQRGYYALAGTHADAELISQMAFRMGWKMIRGSSSKGGSAAFKNIVKTLRQPGTVLYITPDGPKGPALEPKSGTIRAARLTRAVIIPISASATRSWGFTNWDTFYVAKPFSRIELLFGEPFEILADMSEAEGIMTLKTRLDQLSREADRRAGVL
ncbi:MAG: lysophospholipid acyltransferase family protein [Fidelibacterota bacterium]